MTHPSSPDDADLERRVHLLRWYCSRGLRLVPIFELTRGGAGELVCACDDGPACTPKDRGKHPRIPRWTRTASSDEARVLAWHAQWPGSNWAWVLDEHFVIDSDPRNEGFSPATFFMDWEENVGFALTETWTQTTGGGGLHAVYRQPSLGEVRSGKLWLDGRALRGLDLKGTGGYVLVEPSNHASGGAYRWRSFDEPAEAPVELLALRSRRPGGPDVEGRHPSTEHPSTGDGGPWDGARFDWNEALTPGAVPPGDQQSTLYRAAASCRARDLPDEAALEKLIEVVRAFVPGDPADPWVDQHAEDMWERIKQELPAGSGDAGIVREFRPQLTLIHGGHGTNGSVDTSEDTEGPETGEPPGSGTGDGGHTPGQGTGEFTAPPPSEPLTVARWLIDRLWTHDDGIRLLYWRENFLRWEAGAWRVVEDQAIRTQVYEKLESVIFDGAQGPQPWNPTSNKVNQVVDALRAVRFLDGRVEAGTWLSYVDGDPDPRELVAVGNGLLHQPTRELRPHTPRLFNLSCVPFAYEPTATCPRWDDFLDQLWLGMTLGRAQARALDPGVCESMDVLEEFLGYVLSGRTDIHKILLLIGPPRSGRGTILRVLTALVGTEDVAAPTLASLGTNFGLQPLIGKKLVTFTDARIEGRTRTSTIVERLLSLSGEDAITVDRKNRSQWTGRLGVRMILVSNELPELHDASGAVAERFLLLPPLTRSWLGREDLGLTDALLEELPGILNRALDGLDRLVARGRFVEPQAAADSRELLRGLASPTRTFVEDCLEDGDPNWEVEISEVFQAWRTWCVSANEPPGDQATFGKALHAVIPGLRRVRGTGDDGRRQMFYVGIRLKSHVLGPGNIRFDHN